MTTAQQVFDALLTQHGEEIAQAFRAAIEGLRAAADQAALLQAILEGDIQAAIAALHLDPAAMAPIDDAVIAAYKAAGNFGAAQIQAAARTAGMKFVIRFDGRNIRAEQWLRQNSASLISGILEDQKTLVQEALQAGMAAGDNPRTVALELVGKLNRVTGKREGGLIGLTSSQAEYVRSAQTELASDDPALLRNYLSRSLRDRRFDSAVQAAIADGEPLSVKTIQAAAGSYANRMLKYRGDVVARTESLVAMHNAQEEAYQQAIESGMIMANAIRNVWHSAGDSRVRHTHRVLDGETAKQGEAFVSPSGARLRFPGDTELGAGPEEIINCRCWLQKRIDFLANIQ